MSTTKPTATPRASEKLHVLNAPLVGKFLHCFLVSKPGQVLLFKSIGSVHSIPVISRLHIESVGRMCWAIVARTHFLVLVLVGLVLPDKVGHGVPISFLFSWLLIHIFINIAGQKHLHFLYCILHILLLCWLWTGPFPQWVHSSSESFSAFLLCSKLSSFKFLLCLDFSNMVSAYWNSASNTMASWSHFLCSCCSCCICQLTWTQFWPQSTCVQLSFQGAVSPSGWRQIGIRRFGHLFPPYWREIRMKALVCRSSTLGWHIWIGSQCPELLFHRGESSESEAFWLSPVQEEECNVQFWCLLSEELVNKTFPMAGWRAFKNHAAYFQNRISFFVEERGHIHICCCLGVRDERVLAPSDLEKFYRSFIVFASCLWTTPAVVNYPGKSGWIREAISLQVANQRSRIHNTALLMCWGTELYLGDNYILTLTAFNSDTLRG